MWLELLAYKKCRISEIAWIDEPRLDASYAVGQTNLTNAGLISAF